MESKVRTWRCYPLPDLRMSRLLASSKACFLPQPNRLWDKDVARRLGERVCGVSQGEEGFDE